MLCAPILAQAERAELVRQVQASDAIARVYEAGATTRPRTVVPYDQTLRGVVARLDQAAPEPADIAPLTDFELRTVLSLLQLNNIEHHMAISKAGLAADLSTLPIVSPAAIGPATEPARSAVFMKYVSPPKVVVAPSIVEGPAFAPDLTDATDRAALTPRSAAAAVLSGEALQRGFGIPSAVAPLNARRPGSQQLAARLEGTLPMPAYAEKTSPLRSPPPGTASSLLPSDEEIGRIATALGVTHGIAEKIATGQITVAQALTADQQSPITTELLGGLEANDPRWQPLYFGPEIRPWSEHQADGGFSFAPGGGTYVRSDQRLNQDFDMRTNGELDRRVNIQSDRRTTISVDPRVNH